MNPDPTELLEIAGIKNPLIGFYDTAVLKPFAPFVESEQCIYSKFPDLQNGYSIRILPGKLSCQGGSYWVGGTIPDRATRNARSDLSPLEHFGNSLNKREGFKSSNRLMCKWLENLAPYKLKNKYAIIGPIKKDQYGFLKTVTFYVNPDQLSFLVHGAEYNNASISNTPVITAFGSGCGQMAALLGNLDTNKPKALIGATDIAMRIHIPPNLLAFTVNKPMFEQLCSLDEKSFIHKHFWTRLKKTRAKYKQPLIT